MKRTRHLTTAIAIAAAGAAIGTAGAPQPAKANHWHQTCVWHGFVHGSSAWDNLFWARIESGCGTGRKYCALGYIEGGAGPTASVPAGSNAQCNVSSNYGYGEQASYAAVTFDGVFSKHTHNPH